MTPRAACRCTATFVLALGLGMVAAAQAAPEIEDTPAVVHLADGDIEVVMTAERLLASQPEPLLERLMADRVVVLAEVREDGSMSGGLVTAYVIFDSPIDHTYTMLSRSDRQIEFRQELTSIETVERTPEGPIDEHRMKILFKRYVYRLAYRLDPEGHRIDWHLDDRFDNDLRKVDGFWELYEMPDGRTLGRSGTSIDVGPHVPAFLQDWMTRKNMPKTMDRVRLWVDAESPTRSQRP